MATVLVKGDPLRENEYTAGGAIKIGDFVTLDSNGRVVVAAASQALCGIANSVAVNVGDLVKVFDHPEQLLLVVPSATTPSALTDFNLNYNIVANASSSASEGAMTLDSASGATTATLPLKALRLPNVVGQNIAVAGAYAVVCKINNHQLSTGTGTAGT